jgi:hypothetical protein
MYITDVGIDRLKQYAGDLAITMLSSINKYCRVLPNISECYRIVPSVTEYFQVLPNMSKYPGW